MSDTLVVGQYRIIIDRPLSSLPSLGSPSERYNPVPVPHVPLLRPAYLRHPLPPQNVSFFGFFRFIFPSFPPSLGPCALPEPSASPIPFPISFPISYSNQSNVPCCPNLVVVYMLIPCPPPPPNQVSLLPPHPRSDPSLLPRYPFHFHPTSTSMHVLNLPSSSF